MTDQRIIPDFTEPHEGYTNAKLREQVRLLRGGNYQLIEAIERLIAARPTFRSKPMGSPGSPARLEQEEAIAAEDHAKAVAAEAKRL